MKLFDWYDAQVKKMDWLDIGCTKWSAAVFGLLLAKLWPPILGLDWYWYLIIGLVLAIRPLLKVFKK